MNSRLYKYLFIFTILLGGLRSANAESADLEFRLRFEAGVSILDPSFGNNAAILESIDAELRGIASDSTLALRKVTFRGTASPDGRLSFNNRLSVERADAIGHYIRSRVDIPDSCVTRETPGIAWGMLDEMVAASDMQYKDEVLNILRTKPEATYDDKGRLIASRKDYLMKLRGGRPWRYMNEHFYPTLRSAYTVILTVDSATVSAAEESDSGKSASATQSTPSPEPVEEVFVTCDPIHIVPGDSVAPAPARPFYMAVKTNMLYDAVALPNVGVEFYLGKNITAGANWLYGWWSCNRRHRYWRAYGGELNARYWFGSAAKAKPLTGHHIGVYGSLFIYDFELGGKGQMGGLPGEPLWHNPSYMAGVEYGYSLPITRHLNIDFTIGFGYLGGKYYEYTPVDGHYVWERTKQRRWFGPTKAEVTLVWLLGNGNVNHNKGGKR